MNIIILISSLFKEKIKNVALLNNNVNEFINYKIIDENVYSISLPKEWNINETSEKDNKLYINITGSKDITCEVKVIDGDLEKNILNQEKKYSIKKEDDWDILNIINYNHVEKYYIKNYSEGKLLILKFSYNKNKEKDSIDIVFDFISNSFR